MQKAFTLIELLVVVLIIGILSAVALPQYTRAVEKARVAEARIMLKNMAEANQRYYLVNNSYADNLDDLDIDVPGQDVTYYGLARKDAAYFRYGPKGIGSTEGAIAVANRLPVSTNYVLSIYPTNPSQTYCQGYSSKGVAFCKSLGDGSSISLNSYTLYLVQ